MTTQTTSLWMRLVRDPKGPWNFPFYGRPIINGVLQAAALGVMFELLWSML